MIRAMSARPSVAWVWCAMSACSLAPLELYDGGVADSSTSVDLGVEAPPKSDAGAPPPEDLGPADQGAPRQDLGVEAPPDAGSPDLGPPAPGYRCDPNGQPPSNWNVSAGWRAVVVMEDNQELDYPTAITFFRSNDPKNPAEHLLVVSQRNGTLVEVDPRTGAHLNTIETNDWPGGVGLLTFVRQGPDGAVYVADAGNIGDEDSKVFTITATSVELFTRAPGPGLDDTYVIAFPTPNFTQGVLLGGESESNTYTFGLYTPGGIGTAIPAPAVVGSMAFDRHGSYGGHLFVASPEGPGWGGEGQVWIIDSSWSVRGTLVENQGGIHALSFTAGGTLPEGLYALRWNRGRALMHISPRGEVTELATGLRLTHWNGNALAISPDGQVMYVVEPTEDRIVCVEPVP